jgi:hypothetical protein
MVKVIRRFTFGTIVFLVLPNKILKALILISVLFFVIGTVESVQLFLGNTILAVDFIVVISFTIDYALRLWCCVEAKKYKKRGPILGTIIPSSFIDSLRSTQLHLQLLCPYRLYVNRPILDPISNSILLIVRSTLLSFSRSRFSYFPAF